jgi:cysteinyl-tRNA synthetase
VTRTLQATGSLAAETAAELQQLADRFLEAMDDDLNTGGAIGVLFELRRCVNGLIHDQKLEELASTEQKAALTTAMTLLKELTGVLGVFRRPPEQKAGADDAFVHGLMDLILDIRADARKNKNWPVADKIRDALNSLNVVVEDGKEGVRWTRG